MQTLIIELSVLKHPLYMGYETVEWERREDGGEGAGQGGLYCTATRTTQLQTHAHEYKDDAQNGRDGFPWFTLSESGFCCFI